MKPLIQVTHSAGNILKISNDLSIGSLSYTTTNTVIGTTSFPLENTTDFQSAAKIYLISLVGSENAEIVTATSFAAGLIGTSASRQNHNRGERFAQIPFNKYKIEKSTDQGLTWSLLADKEIDPTKLMTTYVDIAGNVGDYYRVKGFNSVDTLTTDSSAETVASEPARYSVQSIINEVIDEVGINPSDTIITQEFLFKQVNAARFQFKELSYGTRFDFMQKYEHPIKMLAGSNTVELPTDIDFTMTNRALLSARLKNSVVYGRRSFNYVDKRQWDDTSYQTTKSTVAQPVSIGDTTIVFENTGDFNDSGSVAIACETFTDTILIVSYTTNDRTTNTLSGISPLNIDRDISVGTQGFINFGVGYLNSYTVYDSQIAFNSPVPQMLNGHNLYIDYYKTIEKLESPTSIIEKELYELTKAYVKFAIKKRKDPEVSVQDIDFLQFQALAQSLKNNAYTGQPVRIINS